MPPHFPSVLNPSAPLSFSLSLLIDAPHPAYPFVRTRFFFPPRVFNRLAVGDYSNFV